MRFPAVLCALAALVPSFASDAKLPRHPAPSPDGKEIAFSWQGDIWVVPSAGGAARRLTAHPASDRFPTWSRDGRLIAFSSDRYGNADVFVLPVDGSAPPQRLTFAATGDQPLAFTPDGRGVLFASRRDEGVLRAPALYTVPLTGGSASLAQSALALWASYSPDGKRLAFVRGGTPWSRRGYRGAANRDIWLREENGSYRRVTDFDGDDDCPSWLDDGTLAFLSSRAGRKNVFVMPAAGGAAKQLTFHDGSDVRFPRAAANGSLVAYEFEDAIWTVSPKGGSPRKLAIDVPADQVRNEHERRVSKDGATGMALSPDGKTVAFLVAGDVFVTAVRSKDDQEIAPPPTVQITATPGRETDLAWSPDGNRLLFSSARDGHFAIYAAERTEAKKDWTENFNYALTRLTDEAADATAAAYAPDGKSIAYVRAPGDLVVMEADGKQKRTLVSHWTAPEFEWSPDGKYIAYSQEDQDSNTEVYIVPSAGGEPYNVSRHPDADTHPTWSPDGRRLAWVSRRHANTLDIWGVWLSRADHERTNEEWLRAWKADKPAPAAPAVPGDGTKGKADAAVTAEKDKEPAASADAAKKPKALPVVKIDFDRLWERATAITEMKGDEEMPRFVDGGKRLVFRAEPEGDRDLYSIRWDGKDAKRLTTGGKVPGTIEVDGTTVFFLDKSGAVQRVGLDAKPGDPVPFQARYVVDQPALRAAVFEEAWRAMDQNFYDPKFHGVDWAAQRAKYRPWALEATSPDDFSDVMNLMLDELNASHLGYRPRPRTDGETTGWIGAVFDAAAGGPGILVKEVLADAPVTRQDVNLVPGERLLGVQNRKVEQGTDVYELFADTAGQRVLLEIQGRDGKTRTAVVVPVTFEAERALRYRQWTRERRAIVDRVSGGRLGYLHIQGMDMPSFETFERDLYAAAHGKDGLIIDVRSNGGGWTMDYLMTVLEVRRHAFTVPRGAPADHRAYPQDRLPLAAWTRPALTLCNEESYSNAEIFSHAFKTLGRGKLVGQRTFGAVISTGATTLLDGAVLRLPGRGWYLAGSGANEENNGAVPDVLVDEPPSQDFSAGSDDQLERAVKVMLDELPKDARRNAW